MKKFTLISIILFLSVNLIYSQDIINETGTDGKFIVRDAEQNEAMVIDNGNVAITGELKVNTMMEGKTTDDMVVWDRESKSLKVIPRVFSKRSPLSKPLDAGLDPSAAIYDPIVPIDGDEPLDYLIYDDLIVTGSECVGFDCADGESFGFNTIVLKEHNLRLHFWDTSYTSNYATNDWTIEINSSFDGGGNYFAIVDHTNTSTPFKIEADAPNNSLYVEDYGRIGFGTSTPIVELHVKDSDTPTLRLEQDNSGGWTAQTFDVASNESNFFVRDATNGSKLPFRIQPNTPSSTLCLKSDGNVGIGTWSPSFPLEIECTGRNASVVVERTGGAMNYMNAAETHGTFGTINNFVARIAQNAEVKIFLDKDSRGLYFGSAGNITSRSDADIDMTITSTGRVGIGTTWPSKKLYVNGSAGGTQAWNASDERYKKNIITVDNPLEDLLKLRGVEYEWIDQSNDESTGFDTKVHYGVIAQEVEKIFPYLVDNIGETEQMKHVEYNGFIAILIESIKEQQELITNLTKRIEYLESN